MNISSVIVIPHPERVDSVVAGLCATDGVEVAAVSPEGKIIVTIETDGDRETVQVYEAISVMDGVMSASMVFHQKEDEPEVEISVEA
jgi:periplasmic nitrate reductase NapD